MDHAYNAIDLPQVFKSQDLLQDQLLKIFKIIVEHLEVTLVT